MFKSIVEQMQWPYWATETYKRQVAMAKMVDGTFYDHLPTDFYTEEDHAGNYIPVVKRRPSAPSQMAFEIASKLSRKMFAGRHAPRITHDNDAYAQWLLQMVGQSAMYEVFLQAMMWGAVGNVAVTFKIIEGKVRMDTWRAHQCSPFFDNAGELSMLRVQYVVKGSTLLRSGYAVDNMGNYLEPSQSYWYVRFWDMERDVTCFPIEEGEWNPNDGDPEMLSPMPEKDYTHGLGFVPGVWVRNLPGADGHLGVSTFGVAVNNIIDLDYTLSQLGRGIRYSAAPQLVLIGDVDESDAMNYRRGPVTTIRLKSSYADEATKLGGSDAKLLEMVGNGTQVGLNYVDVLRKTIINMVSVSVRSPGTHQGTISGRAMEIMDDGFLDLVNALRTSYGDGAFVPLLSKIVRAFDILRALPSGLPTGDDLTGFGLRWPRVFPSTPGDEMQMVEGFTMAVQNGLIDEDIARSYLHTQLDLEDYRVKTPVQTGADTDNGEGVPEPGDAPGGEDEKYNEGINPDSRRPGPQGHTLPRRRVGGKQVTI